MEKQITFGNYFNSPISWTVIKEDSGKSLLLSDKVIEFLPFSEIRKETLWDKSYVRDFLNNYFFNNAFSDLEKSQILETEIETNVNTINLKNVNNSIKTNDKVFILSPTEINSLVKKSNVKGEMVDSLLDCFNLTYREKLAKRKGEAVTTRTTSYWLRTNGVFSSAATIVNLQGNIEFGGVFNNTYAGVRPAIWVKL